ncbi:probable pre-mRNA-splicing factor ATP-dependent RNA helicase DEAH3 [Typha angustifolia]|uniref:probable pre-mRNA-splicing factor ATP-dependent RNA helicase DEAH3 n=1 Tax=Typha angustifolia TaxID=59011 RepID=UPI003C2B432A
MGSSEAAAATEEEVNPLTGSRFSRRYQRLLEKRKTLPLWAKKKAFLDTLAEHQVIVVAAPPGSGKSTLIPQFVIEGGYPTSSGKQIACVQPRRIVATALSHQVAEQMDVKVGEEVGYSVLFKDCCSSKTILKYITDGVLLRETLSDQLLQNYEVIILDEVHLRTLATDILISYLRNLLSANSRPDLKLIIMCTQFEAKHFRDYFKVARVLKSIPSLHPVDITYEQDPVRDYVAKAIEIVEKILVSEPTGDILLFLTGLEEIETCCWKLGKVIADLGDKVGPVRVLPLHSTIFVNDQLKKVFKSAPPRTRKGGPAGRKVVVSTDIAESSLVIDGIIYVIDCGYMKQKVYNAQLCIETTLILPISRASAQRRAGCARRLGPGKCFRLYPEKFFTAFTLQVSPEILRANLASTLLLMKRLGIDDISHLDLMDPPPPETIARALETLSCLGAFDGEGILTKFGELMSEFPLDPQMSRMIVSSPQFHCSNEILSIAAMVSVPNCFLRPTEDQQAADEAKRNFSHKNGDHLTLLNVYHAYKLFSNDPSWCDKNYVNQAVLQYAVSVRSQLVSIMKKIKLELCSTDVDNCDYYDNIRKGLLAGYFMQVARLELWDRYTILKTHHVVDLHPSCCINSRPQWVIFNDFVMASHNFIRMITDVRVDWLMDVAPNYYRITTV